jgi:hypothetical protein
MAGTMHTSVWWDSDLILVAISLIQPTPRRAVDFRGFTRQPQKKAIVRQARFPRALGTGASWGFAGTAARSQQLWSATVGHSQSRRSYPYQPER